MYGELHPTRWNELGMEWDKTHSMFKYLKKLSSKYQMTFERRLFNIQWFPELRCTLVRWGELDQNGNTPRNVLLETDDPKQMEATLTMLIANAEAEARERRGPL